MTVRVMDATDGNLVAIEATGRLTDIDYKAHLAPRMESVLDSGDSLRVLINMDENFKGFAAGAVWQDARFVAFHPLAVAKGKFERIALVGGDGDPYVRAAEAFDVAWPGEIRRFHRDELDQALAWVKS